MLTIFPFKGGVHPADSKEYTKDRPITRAAVPSRLYVPLVQHIGAPCAAAVQAGDEVKKGQVIGTAGGFVSAPVHSPVSGKVSAIASVPHLSGTMVNAAVIDNDGQEQWTELVEHRDYGSVAPEKLREIILSAGLVGMGGATFPTHVKLAPPKGKPVDTVIINGAECEPYLTADYRLMLEHPREIIEGAKIIMKALNVTKGYIGIEANKPQAVEALKKELGSDTSLSIGVCKVKYPQGAEKMLIKALCNREVPPRGLPMDVGVVVQNVATAKAAYDAVRFGHPLIERVVTVVGDAVAEPKNVLARIGMTVADLIAECGGFRGEAGKIVMGGPMMGVALYSTDFPVTKGTSGVLVLSKQYVQENETYGPCIKCGRCIDACPMGLIPSMLGILVEKGKYEETREYHLHDCFECGSCTYVCPAKRPMVQFIKLGKSLVKP
ncbi:MAG: electron transport complex subunit RsxC [Chitinispirillaceae bacterium]|nr:electron transport complex subunit RsxC [Chitinispirillaceae bacterium]